ncbi:isochorismate synthase MenF [Alcanivoracaceae bacterium MT1]
MTRITTPAWEGWQRDGDFQRAIHSALERAGQAGLSAPIVMGAIPFNTRQPSCLYIPRHYEWREPAAAPTNAENDVPASPCEVSYLPQEAVFKRAVRQAIANFQHSDIRKVVLSRILELQLPDAVNIDQLLARLRHQNPQGYQFRVPMTDGATLVGVSPELLLHKNGTAIRSNPLAGSAKRQADSEQDRAVAEKLLSSSKDHYEHRLVIEGVRQVLGPYCSHLDIPETPSLISTSALWHLSTVVEGSVADPDTTALQLACRLHPTPAVCGYPTGSARKLIDLVESFDRGLFTGMVGWCDAEGNGEWAVTIRCGSIHHDTIRLFAGAGIVKASQPDAEWGETQAKLGTMLNAFGLDISQLDTQPLPGRTTNKVIS